MPKLIRITTASISLNVLLPGQMRFMREHGMEVLMVSSDGPELQEVIDREGCRHVVVPMTRRISPWQDLLCLFQLIRLFRAEMPDIVHSHTPKAGLLSMLAGLVSGVNIRIHTVAGLRYVSEIGFRRQLLISMERMTSWAATHVWVNGKSLEQKILTDKITQASKITMVGAGSSNGIDLTRFNSDALVPEVLEKVKKSIGYDFNNRYIICVGRIVGDKGINELVDAFLQLNRKYPSLKLILVGAYESELDPISPFTKKMIGENPNILVTGWTSDVAYYLSLAALLVHPSHREGFPNVLLQAGALGCPVVCSEIDGNRDIVENRISGLTFSVKDRKLLTDTLEIALSEYSQMQRYAAVLQGKVVENFSQPVFWNLVLEKYRSIVASQ